MSIPQGEYRISHFEHKVETGFELTEPGGDREMKLPLIPSDRENRSDGEQVEIGSLDELLDYWSETIG